MQIKSHVKDDVRKGMIMQSIFNVILKLIYFPLFANCTKGGMQVITSKGKNSYTNFKWAWKALQQKVSMYAK
jgi:hypothetical protein